MDCEHCGAELPEEGNFCSNCGAPRPSVASSPSEDARPCRKCGEQVQVGAAFCWNCGVEAPHQAPAQTGNTVVSKPPQSAEGDAQPSTPASEKKEDFEWEEQPTGNVPPLEQAALGASTMRMGTGSPPPVPPEPTEPKAVTTGLPVDAKRGMSTSFQEHDAEEPPTTPRLVVSMIEEELEEELKTNALGEGVQAVDDDGSEPLLLEADVDAAVAKVVQAQNWPDLAEEVAELQLLMLRGFTAEAKDALQLLVDAHPGHPELESLCAELEVSPNPPEVSKGPAIGPRENTAPKSVPDITKVTLPRVGNDDDPPPPVETPTSPSFVEGTSPPPGGFAPPAAVPQGVEPNVTPRLGIESARRMHSDSSESIPTMPRMSKAEVESAVNTASVSVRLVMLGTRGQSVWEQTFPLGQVLEVGRDPTQPWGDDPHLEPQHARLHATAEGVRIEPLGHAGTFRQVDERLAVRDGDEFRVGESLLRYTATGGWGSLTWFPLSGTTSNTIPVGGAGVMVGRENADIEIPEDTFVSGAHCRFTCRDDGLFIEDLGSANGTYTRVRDGEMVPFGGLVLLGQTQFKVRRNSEA